MSEYLKSILNAFHDLLFVFTEDGVIADYITPNHEDELILPKEDFLGKHHQEVLPPHVSKKIEQAFDKINQGEEQVKFDYSLELKGEKNWYEAVISKMAYKDESRYLVAVRNITERKNDELLLRGILRNLIANGIKFSHPGGKIDVHAETTDGEVEISVADEGVGIEKDNLEKILDKKSNYTSRGTKGEKGSGLGLDLCIDFVKKHGGKIRAESEPDKGTTFTFTLPNGV